jgi:hypothetical protein
MDMRVRMAASGFACVRVGLMIDFYGNRVEAPVAYAAFSDQVVGKVLHVAVAAPQNSDFNARVVIQVNVHCRQRDFVMLMERIDEAIGQSARRMVVDVDQRADAIAATTCVLRRLGEAAPRQIPDCLRAILVPARRDKPIYLGHEIVVDGDRNPVHVMPRFSVHSRHA